jgi:bifunctional non-homologous end joining protein LigD
MRPMLATRGSSLPRGAGWVHEVKWDGMRVLVAVGSRGVRLTSRNENDVTVSFPELQGIRDAAEGRELLLDGEIVAFSDGIPVFGALADRMHVRSARKAEHAAVGNPVTLLVFDVLQVDGEDVTGLPHHRRREVLEQLGLSGPHWQVPPAYDDGQALWEATKAQGLEGIVSKRRSSPYVPGRRSDDWLKFPHRPTGSYVVGGWRPEKGSRGRLGALLVGEMTPQGLVYRGRVGSGVAGKASLRLSELVAGSETAECPFVDEVPRVDCEGTVWVEPTLVVEVASLGLTQQRRLRQPAYVGVRADLRPDDLLDLEETLDG